MPALARVPIVAVHQVSICMLFVHLQAACARSVLCPRSFCTTCPYACHRCTLLQQTLHAVSAAPKTTAEAAAVALTLAVRSPVALVHALFSLAPSVLLCRFLHA
jgi:hypothetical protein